MATDNGFLTDDVLEFDKVTKNASVKSNLLLFGKNFTKLKAYLDRSKAYIAYLTELINVQELVNTVIEQFQASKISLALAYGMPSGTSDLIKVGNINYQISRLSNTAFEITNANDTDESKWNVDKLIVSVKDVDGVIVYPKITTANHKIKIDFIDGLLSNYQVIIF